MTLVVRVLIYLEPQVNAFGYMAPDGSEISPDEVAKQINARLAQRDAQSLGITWRFQQAILRFIPSAEQSLEESWAFISRNEPWVARLTWWAGRTTIRVIPYGF